jgi:hypothetical protein
MLHFLLGTAVIVLPRGNLPLLAAIGAVKGAGERFDSDLDTFAYRGGLCCTKDQQRGMCRSTPAALQCV